MFVLSGQFADVGRTLGLHCRCLRMFPGRVTLLTDVPSLLADVLTKPADLAIGPHNRESVNLALRNRWRDHRCHYKQLSWHWDEEWVTCRWSMICASSWLQSWNDDTANSLLESTTSDSVQRRRYFHPCQSWPAVYRLMRRAPFILHICRYDSQSFLRIGVLPSSCGSGRIPISNPRRCCVQDFKFCSG